MCWGKRLEFLADALKCLAGSLNESAGALILVAGRLDVCRILLKS